MIVVFGHGEWEHRKELHQNEMGIKGKSEGSESFVAIDKTMNSKILRI